MHDHLDDLEQGKIYTITFDVNEMYSAQKIKCVKVLIKLRNSIQLEDIDTNEVRWYRSMVSIDLLDEMPVKYLRKQKLEKIEENGNNG